MSSINSITRHKGLFIPVALLALLVAGALFAFGLTDTAPAEAAPSGAIFTTLPDGSSVNANVQYTEKIEVYLDGGPPGNAPTSAAGLDPDIYVFQITNPAGNILLSSDPAKCRLARVNNRGVFFELVLPGALTPAETGIAAGTDLTALNALSAGYDHDNDTGTTERACHIPDGTGNAGADGQHDTNTDIDNAAAGAIVIQMMPFFDTTNPGGVYKAWVKPLRSYLRDATAGRGNNASTAADALNDIEPLCLKRNGRPASACNAGNLPAVGFEEDPGFFVDRGQVKTDNFKVDLPASTITVRKFWDKNNDGIWQMATEPEIGKDGVIDDSTNICVKSDGTQGTCNGFGGWPITITEPSPPMVDTGFTVYIEDAAKKGKWKVCDDGLPGWGQTATYTSQDINSLGSNLFPTQTTPDPGKKCVFVTVVKDTNENHVVVFGNAHLYNKLVITCNEVLDTLVESTSDLTKGPDGDITADAKDTVENEDLDDVKFGGVTPTTTVSDNIEAHLCALADKFGHTGLERGTYEQTDVIPKS